MSEGYLADVDGESVSFNVTSKAGEGSGSPKAKVDAARVSFQVSEGAGKGQPKAVRKGTGFVNAADLADENDEDEERPGVSFAAGSNADEKAKTTKVRRDTGFVSQSNMPEEDADSKVYSPFMERVAAEEALADSHESVSSTVNYLMQKHDEHDERKSPRGGSQALTELKQTRQDLRVQEGEREELDQLKEENRRLWKRCMTAAHLLQKAQDVLESGRGVGETASEYILEAMEALTWQAAQEPDVRIAELADKEVSQRREPKAIAASDEDQVENDNPEQVQTLRKGAPTRQAIFIGDTDGEEVNSSMQGQERREIVEEYESDWTCEATGTQAAPAEETEAVETEAPEATEAAAPAAPAEAIASITETPAAEANETPAAPAEEAKTEAVKETPAAEAARRYIRFLLEAAALKHVQETEAAEAIRRHLASRRLQRQVHTRLPSIAETAEAEEDEQAGQQAGAPPLLRDINSYAQAGQQAYTGGVNYVAAMAAHHVPGYGPQSAQSYVSHGSQPYWSSEAAAYWDGFYQAFYATAQQLYGSQLYGQHMYDQGQQLYGSQASMYSGLPVPGRDPAALDAPGLPSAITVRDLYRIRRRLLAQQPADSPRVVEGTYSLLPATASR